MTGARKPKPKPKPPPKVPPVQPPTPPTPPTVLAPGIAAPVQIVNESTKLRDADVETARKALQRQTSEHFGLYWHTDAHLLAPGETPSSPAWLIHLVDYPGSGDPGSALGYHDVGPDGLPYSRVFVGTSLDHNIAWSSVVSHELLETLADPFVFSVVFVQDTNTTGVLYPLEACDAPEALSYAIDGVAVSAFVTPAWFMPGSNGPWSYPLAAVAGPLRLRTGGYIGTFGVTQGTGWGQRTASLPPILRQVRSRRRYQMLPGDES